MAVGGLGVLSVHSGKIGSPTPGDSYETASRQLTAGGRRLHNGQTMGLTPDQLWPNFRLPLDQFKLTSGLTWD